MKAVILAGGTGTRLWPLSTKRKPKQFQIIYNKKTLLEQAIEQVNFLKPSDIFIATNSEYQSIVKELTINLIPPENLIIEPALRDTGPCLGLIATILSSRFSDKEVMAVTYADQFIQNHEILKHNLLAANELAKTKHTLNIIEVPTKFPNPNFGYVEINKKIPLDSPFADINCYSLKRFTEKPNFETAKTYVESGNFLWNTGRYVWRVGDLLSAFEKYQPEMFNILQIIKKNLNTPKEIETIENLYPTLPQISIDYAIMEKIDPNQVLLLKAELNWNDLGTWDSIYDELTKHITNPEDEKPNLIQGNHLGIKTSGSLIYNLDSKLITTLGIQNLIIVQTPETLLICNKNKSHELKDLIELLKQNHQQLL